MRSLALIILIAVSSAIGIELQEIEAPKDQLLQDSLEYEEKIRKDTSKTDGLQDTTAADTLQYQAIRLKYNHPEKTFSLQDKAQLSYKGAKLSADTIFFNNSTMLLNAFGDPMISDGTSSPLYGYQMRYNIKRRIGQIYYGSTFRDQQQFNGMSIKRLPDGRLQIARGDFSTCDNLNHQHFYFYTRKMSAKPKEKMVAAPVILNIEDVPVVILPIMVSPLSNEASSGLIPPTPGGDQQQGFYLRGLGYYWAINQYMDFTAKTDIIEGQYGTFPKNSISSKFNYKVLYLLNGHLDGKFHFVTSKDGGFAYDLDGWDFNFSHSQNLTPDKKTTLSGNGSFVSSGRARLENALDHDEALNQKANAFMTFRKQFKNNSTLTLTARQNKSLNKNPPNTTTRELPNIKYSINGHFFDVDEDDLNDSLYEDSWYEKVSYNYSWEGNHNQRLKEDWVYSDTTYENNIITRDSALIEVDTNRVGFKHDLSIGYKGKLMEVINVTPSFKYFGLWSAYSYDNPGDSIDRSYSFNNDISNGEFGDYYQKWNSNLSASTELYGIWKPNISRFIGVRHVLTPTIGATYQPRLDSNATFVPNKQVHSGVLKQDEKYSINMSLSNSFDIKYKAEKENRFQSSSLRKSSGTDTTDLNEEEAEDLYEEKKRRLLTTSSRTSYNFAADSLNWSDISSSVGLQITDSDVFTISLGHSMYDKLSANPIRVRTPALHSYSYGFSKAFRWSGNFNDGLTSKNYKYTSAPWDATFRYSYNFRATRISRQLDFNEIVSHNTSSFVLNIRPTQKWNMNYTTNYDFKNAEFARHEFSFSRSLHCWQLKFTWTPVGPSQGWSFKIWVIDIPDIKLDASNKEVKTSDIWNVVK